MYLLNCFSYDQRHNKDSIIPFLQIDIDAYVLFGVMCLHIKLKKVYVLLFWSYNQILIVLRLMSQSKRSLKVTWEVDFELKRCTHAFKQRTRELNENIFQHGERPFISIVDTNLVILNGTPYILLQIWKVLDEYVLFDITYYTPNFYGFAVITFFLLRRTILWEFFLNKLNCAGTQFPIWV